MKNKTLYAALILTLVFSFSLPACMTTKTSVGAYREMQGEEYTYAKGKQFWMFWGLIPLGRASVNTPGDGNCQVVTRRRFGDLLITVITAGILKSYTIKVKAKRVPVVPLPAANPGLAKEQTTNIYINPTNPPADSLQRN